MIRVVYAILVLPCVIDLERRENIRFLRKKWILIINDKNEIKKELKCVDEIKRK